MSESSDRNPFTERNLTEGRAPTNRTISEVVANDIPDVNQILSQNSRDFVEDAGLGMGKVCMLCFKNLKKIL